MDMKKLLGIVSGDKTKLNESIADISGMQMGPVAQPVQPVTMSVSVNAQGIDQIKDFLSLMSGAASSPAVQQPVEFSAEPEIAVEPEPEFKIPVASDDNEIQPSTDSSADNEITAIKNLAGIKVEPAAKPIDSKKAEMMSAVLAAAKKSKGSEEAETEGQYDASTTPDPSYQDINYMTKDIAGGLNKEKTMHKHSYKQGDNPMAMETIEMLKKQLFQDYASYKLDESTKVSEADIDVKANNSDFTMPLPNGNGSNVGKATKSKHKVTWQRDKEGVAPNGKQYNSTVIVDAVDKYIVDAEVNSLEDFHRGAVDVVDVTASDGTDPNLPVRAILYVVDNHKYGMWKPWKNKPATSEPLSFSREPYK
jgi:hypothetical protein